MVFFSVLISLSSEAKVYKNLEDALENPKEVISIKICYGFFDTLPDIFHLFPNLTELNLSDNRLKELPKSIFSCKKLKVLKLKKTGLQPSLKR